MKTFGQVKKLIILTIATAAIILGVIECANCAYILGGKVQVKIELEGGQKELEKADYESALNIYMGALKQDPYNVDAYWGAASAYIGLNNFEKAVETLENANKMFSAIEDSRDVSTYKNEIRVRLEQIKIMDINS